MATDTFDAGTFDRFRPRKSTLYVAGAMIAAEAILVAWYLALTDDLVYDPTVLAFPFVWINVGVLAVWRTTPAPADPRRRGVAALVAVGYAAVLAYAGGLLGPGAAFGGPPVDGVGVRLDTLPGMRPTVTYSGELLYAALIPYKVVGYAALVYLVYATVIDAAGSAISGVLGLFSCVSCTWPIAASLLTGVVGAGGAATAARFMPGQKVSALVFVVTVALLYWRPTVR